MTDIKPGDIVTGYHKGYHKVDKVAGTQVYYTRVDGPKKPNCCHHSYCKIIDPNDEFDRIVKEATELRDLLIAAKSVDVVLESK